MSSVNLSHRIILYPFHKTPTRSSIARVILQKQKLLNPLITVIQWSISEWQGARSTHAHDDLHEGAVTMRTRSRPGPRLQCAPHPAAVPTPMHRTVSLRGRREAHAARADTIYCYSLTMGPVPLRRRYSRGCLEMFREQAEQSRISLILMCEMSVW